MKSIQVAAAIIKKNNKILATQRGYGDYKGNWEFPGGKIEPGETAEEALVREIREELSADIAVHELVDTVEFDYPKFHLKMYCFMCELLSDNFELLEHDAAKWLDQENLFSVGWLEADLGVLEKIKWED